MCVCAVVVVVKLTSETRTDAGVLLQHWQTAFVGILSDSWTFLGRFWDVFGTVVGRLLDVSQHSRRFPAVPLIGRPKAPLGFDECGR